jgi:hypothetical protein
MSNSSTSTGEPVQITPAEIEHKIALHYRATTFQKHLEDAVDTEILMRIMCRYIHYCSVFGGCQASLAGEMSVRQDVFRDDNEPGPLADNSVEVAAGVFFGAVDEFGDREMTQRRTHRSLAQATLKALAQFYNYDTNKLDHVMIRHQPTHEAIQRALIGYGVNIIMDEPKLFRALGFHLGTEILADQEFGIMNVFFRTKRPDIARYLEQAEIQVGGQTLPAYFWISRHTVADAEHFDAAVQSANQALQYYAGTADRTQVKEWILEGVQEIAVLEADFMSHVAQY